MHFTYDPSLPESSFLHMAWRHAKTASMVGFGLAIAAVLFLGQAHFRLTARLVCPPGTQLIYEEIEDSDGDTSIRGYCLKPGGTVQDQTLVFVLAIYAMYTLGAFGALMAAGTLIRLIRAAQKGRGKDLTPPET